MASWVRLWTGPERNGLFERYFDSVPSTCPACYHPVVFRMHYTAEVVALSVRCENCLNMAVMLFNGFIGFPAEKVTHGT